MKGDKTKIWRGGLAEIMRAHLPDAGTARPARADESPPPTFKGPRPNARAVLGRALAGGTIVGHPLDLSALQSQPKGVNLSATRVLPIESLLATPSDASGQDAAAPSASGPQKGASRYARTKARTSAAVPGERRAGMAHVRRGLMAALGVFIVGSWLWGEQHGRPAAHAQRPNSASVQQTAPASRAQAQRASTKEAAKPMEPRVATATPAPRRQRQAVDALASGDFAAARNIYAELASSVEGPSAYAEAARILEARLKTSTF